MTQVVEIGTAAASQAQDVTPVGGNAMFPELPLATKPDWGFTGGQWQIVQESFGWATLGVRFGDRDVAKVCSVQYEHGMFALTSQAHANAKLILAAPHLVRALESIVECLPVADPWGPVSVDRAGVGARDMMIWETARAALARLKTI